MTGNPEAQKSSPKMSPEERREHAEALFADFKEASNQIRQAVALREKALSDHDSQLFKEQSALLEHWRRRRDEAQQAFDDFLTESDAIIFAEMQERRKKKDDRNAEYSQHTRKRKSRKMHALPVGSGADPKD